MYFGKICSYYIIINICVFKNPTSKPLPVHIRYTLTPPPPKKNLISCIPPLVTNVKVTFCSKCPYNHDRASSAF